MANNMLSGAILMWKQLFVKLSFIIWWESSKDDEIFTKWQNELMFLKITEFLASQRHSVYEALIGFPCIVFFFYLGHLLSQLSSIFSLHEGQEGEWPGGKVATRWALQSLEHLLSMDFKALNSVWCSCELRSASLRGCELVIGLQYITEKYNPELFSWLLGQCAGQEMTREHWLTGNWGANG